MINKGFKSWKKQLELVKDIEGLLVPGQEKAFMIIASKLPKNAVVVEIGSFKGKSTSCIALGSPRDTKIYVIDTFEGNQKDFSEGVQFLGGNFYNEFDSNLKKIGERKKITAIKGHSQTVGKKWNKKIDFLFIDGSHIYEDVKKDYEIYYPWVKPGGIVAFHDVHKKFPGVLKLWKEKASKNLLSFDNIHTLYFGIKPQKGLAKVKAKIRMTNLINKIKLNKVFVIMPVYNRLEATKKCLESLEIQSYQNVKAIVVDDGSTDGTSSYVKKNYPDVEIIKGNGKWFWTKSMYEGVKKALTQAEETDYILTMNNDCYFKKNYIKNMVEGDLKSPQTITGSLIVSARNPRKVVDAGVLINWQSASIFGMSDKVSDDLKFYTDRGEITDFDTLPGKGTLIPVSVFEKIGNFNYKRLPHYIGDYEFFCRAKRAGFKLVICSKTILYNFVEMTGTSHLPTHKASWKTSWSILFGRKSKLNIIDHLNFLILCCPKKYFFVNLKQVLDKLATYSLMVFPLYYIKVAIDIYNKSKYPLRLFLHNLPIRIYQSPPVSKFALFIHNLPIFLEQNKNIKKFKKSFEKRLSARDSH